MWQGNDLARHKPCTDAKAEDSELHTVSENEQALYMLQHLYKTSLLL